MSPHVPTWMVQYLVTEFTLTPTPVTPALPLSVLLPFFHVFFFYPTTKPCCDKSSPTMNTLCSLATENPAVSYSFLYTCSCVNPLFLPSLLRLSCSYSPSSPSCSLISDSMNSTPTLSFFFFLWTSSLSSLLPHPICVHPQIPLLYIHTCLLLLLSLFSFTSLSDPCFFYFHTPVSCASPCHF